MSQRFYVNRVQIFGNNEMFENTHDEIARQGGVWELISFIQKKKKEKKNGKQ